MGNTRKQKEQGKKFRQTNISHPALLHFSSGPSLNVSRILYCWRWSCDDDDDCGCIDKSYARQRIGTIWSINILDHCNWYNCTDKNISGNIPNVYLFKDLNTNTVACFIAVAATDNVYTKVAALHFTRREGVWNSNITHQFSATTSQNTTSKQINIIIVIVWGK